MPISIQDNIIHNILGYCPLRIYIDICLYNKDYSHTVAENDKNILLCSVYFNEHSRTVFTPVDRIIHFDHLTSLLLVNTIDTGFSLVNTIDTGFSLVNTIDTGFSLAAKDMAPRTTRHRGLN